MQPWVTKVLGVTTLDHEIALARAGRQLSRDEPRAPEDLRTRRR